MITLQETEVKNFLKFVQKSSLQGHFYSFSPETLPGGAVISKGNVVKLEKLPQSRRCRASSLREGAFDRMENVPVLPETLWFRQ